MSQSLVKRMALPRRLGEIVKLIQKVSCFSGSAEGGGKGGREEEREKKKEQKRTKFRNAQRTTFEAQILIFGYVINIKT